MTRKHPHVALFLAASAALAISAMPPALAAPEAAASGCQAAPKGLVENSWLGGSGSWSDATNGRNRSSPASRPGTTPASRRVRTSSWTPPSARVDLDLLDLDSGARLTLQPGTALYVWGDQQELRSVVRSDAVLEVDGATLGGGGRLQVIGTLDVHRAADGTPAALSSRPVSSPSKGRKGLLEIADQGVLDVHGAGDVRLARKYVVDVRGLVRLRDDAGLVADHGTTMLLQQHSYGSGVGPTSVCCLTCSYSSSVSGPCLFSTSSRMPIFPMSWSRPAVRTVSTSSSLHPICAAIIAERSATSRRVATGIGVLGLKGVDQRLKSGDRDALLIRLLLSELGGTLDHLILQPLIDLETFEPTVPSRSSAPVMARPRWGRSIGLDEVVERSALHAQGGGRCIVHGGQHEERDGPARSP